MPICYTFALLHSWNVPRAKLRNSFPPVCYQERKIAKNRHFGRVPADLKKIALYSETCISFECVNVYKCELFSTRKKTKKRRVQGCLWLLLSVTNRTWWSGEWPANKYSMFQEASVCLYVWNQILALHKKLTAGTFDWNFSRHVLRRGLLSLVSIIQTCGLNIRLPP